MARRKKSSSLGWLVILALVVMAAGGSVAYYAVRSAGKDIKLPSVRPSATVMPHPGLSKPEITDRKFVIYLVKITPTSAYLVPVTRTTGPKGDILYKAVETLLKEGHGKVELIPEGTKLLSPIKVKGDTATVNLSSQFVDNFPGGSDLEALTLNSIAHTIVSNSDGNIRKVQILVEGDTAETLGGHFDLTEPITPDSTLLKPQS